MSRNFTGALPSAQQFAEYVIKTPRFNLILARFTINTYVLVVVPPGEAELQCTRFNILAAREEFSQIEEHEREEMNAQRLKGENETQNDGTERKIQHKGITAVEDD